MTRRRIHFREQVLFGTLAQPLCQNQQGRDAIADAEREVEMTDDEAEVTCRRCLRALGYEPVSVERRPEPVSQRRAA